jgi:hypothetical protein
VRRGPHRRAAEGSQEVNELERAASVHNRDDPAIALNTPRAGAMLESMMTLKAHVKNGQLVLDEPAELPEGVEADILLHIADPHEEMDAEERAELLRSIDEGLAAGDAGDEVEFDEYLAALRARRA